MYEDMAASDSRFETYKYCRARWPPAVSREGAFVREKQARGGGMRGE